MKKLLLLTLGCFSLLLSACGTEDGGPGIISTTAPMEAKYNPTDSIIPFPNNLLIFGGPGPVDGTLDIAVVDPNDITDPKVAMNTLDGFSTVAPITTTFGLPIDATTITNTSVRVFEVFAGSIAQGYGVGAIKAELTFGVQFKALPSPSNPNVLVIKPVTPLNSNAQYMVVVTNALKATTGQAARASAFYTLLKNTSPLVDANGVSQVPGRDDATAASLEGLRQLNQAMLGVAGTATPVIAAADVAIAWSFKTQTLNIVLPQILADTAADPYANDVAALQASATATPAATFAAVAGLPIAAYSNLGSVVTGAIQLPYYLDGSIANPTSALTTQFSVGVNGAPALKSVQAVKYILTIPNTVAGPWKVAIFQHGFAVDKSSIFGIANSLALQGYATIAIDTVLHGDRTFGLDVVTQVTDANGRSQTTAAVPDGIADSSGTHYLNLTSLLTTRDNVRQSVADLIHLAQNLRITTLDVVINTAGATQGTPGVDTPDLDTAAPIVYVGHSNGGIIGSVLAGVVPAATISKYLLVNPGGDYASILQASEAYSPIVNAGLAAKGVAVGSADYGAFFVAAQTVADDGDPLNYATAAAAKSIFLMKTKADGVVPNAQTDNLSLALGLPQVSGNSATVTANLWPLTVVAPPLLTNGFVNYTAGTHASFLSPVDSAAATTAMQTDAVTYIVSGAITTSDIAVME